MDWYLVILLVKLTANIIANRWNSVRDRIAGLLGSLDHVHGFLLWSESSSQGAIVELKLAQNLSGDKALFAVQESDMENCGLLNWLSINDSTAPRCLTAAKF